MLESGLPSAYIPARILGAQAMKSLPVTTLPRAETRCLAIPMIVPAAWPHFPHPVVS
jgi:hypothetical protein